MKTAMQELLDELKEYRDDMLKKKHGDIDHEISLMKKH